VSCRLANPFITRHQLLAHLLHHGNRSRPPTIKQPAALVITCSTPARPIEYGGRTSLPFWQRESKVGAARLTRRCSVSSFS